MFKYYAMLLSSFNNESHKVIKNATKARNAIAELREALNSDAIAIDIEELAYIDNALNRYDAIIKEAQDSVDTYKK